MVVEADGGTVTAPFLEPCRGAGEGAGGSAGCAAHPGAATSELPTDHGVFSPDLQSRSCRSSEGCSPSVAASPSSGQPVDLSKGF